MPLPPIIDHFAPLAGGYDVVLSDVWGVVHNGVAATPEACDALERFRGNGGTVVLITNAPRPGRAVVRTMPARLGRAAAASAAVRTTGDRSAAPAATAAG